MAFNRGNRGGGNFRKGGFGGGGRSFDRPQMHQAVCDNCGKNCEVPFRPTSGKPIYCSDCFEKNNGGESRRPSGGRNFERTNFEDRPKFDAVCDECGNNCQVPFKPSGDKPIYCSNCFGDKKNGARNSESSQPNYKEQFETLNAKLDKILGILLPIVKAETPSDEIDITHKKTKSPKKTAPVKE